MSAIRDPRRRNPSSPLARVVGASALNTPEILALRRRVWRETGIAVVKPEDVRDDNARAALVKAADALFGPRSPRVLVEKQTEKENS